MAIYTKTGDKGETSLASGERISKADVRIEAYGTVDELNSFIGLLRVTAESEQLAWIQNKLFNLGALLSAAPGEWISEADVTQLEQWIDAMQAVVPPMRAFILPAGGETVCRCHVCRTICRRAERRILALGEQAEVQPELLQFINRLSDYLFVLARKINIDEKKSEIFW